MEGSPVKVYIYDITKGLARSMSGALLGKQLDGVWHTAIVAFDQEFFYGGGGIESCQPGNTVLGRPDKVENLGNTELPFEMLMDYLQELSSSTFRPERYHLFNHNCNTFSNELAQFLTGSPIPSYITSLPQEVLSTPFGAMMRPFVDAMSVNPGGGTPIGQSHRGGFPITEQTKPQALGGSTGSSTSQTKPTTGARAQTTTAGSSGDNPQDVKSSPVVYRERDVIGSEFECVKETLRQALSTTDLALLEECMEYITSTDPDWGLSRGHIKIIERILSESGYTTGQKRAAAGLLQEVLTQHDLVAMLVHDPASAYVTILQMFDQHNDSVQERLVKGLCNCSSHKEGADWLLGSSTNQVEGVELHTAAICRSCLLQEKAALHRQGAALAFNLTNHKVSEDQAVDLGCALVELLHRDIDQTTAKYGILSLCQCIDANNEVAAIATVSGVNVSSLSEKHPELKGLCNSQLKAALEKYPS